MEWIFSALIGSGATIGLYLLSGLVKGVLSVKKYREVPEQFFLDQGFAQSSFLRKLLLPNLDESAMNEIVEYTSDLPNYYDLGWDAGMLGNEKPKLDDLKK